MKLLFFILMWFYMGEVARVKFGVTKEDGFGIICLVYILAPIVHISILISKGFEGYFKDDWDNF